MTTKTASEAVSGMMNLAPEPVGRFFVDFGEHPFRCGRVDALVLYGRNPTYMLRLMRVGTDETNWSVLSTLGQMEDFNFFVDEKSMLKAYGEVVGAEAEPPPDAA